MSETAKKEKPQYPKQLYAKGWEDLNATVVVHDEEGEKAARAKGYKMLGEKEPAKAPAK